MKCYICGRRVRKGVVHNKQFVHLECAFIRNRLSNLELRISILEKTMELKDEKNKGPL